MIYSISSYIFALDIHIKLINIGDFIMNHLLLLGTLGTGEIIVIAFAILLLFGGKKIPELMKGIGKGVKNFREGVKGIEDEIKLEEK